MSKNIIAAAAILAVVVSGYFAVTFSMQKSKEIENEARFQCAQSSRYQVAKEGTTIWYPAEELYAKCLNEKGVK